MAHCTTLMLRLRNAGKVGVFQFIAVCFPRDPLTCAGFMVHRERERCSRVRTRGLLRASTCTPRRSRAHSPSAPCFILLTSGLSARGVFC